MHIWHGLEVLSMTNWTSTSPYFNPPFSERRALLAAHRVWRFTENLFSRIFCSLDFVDTMDDDCCPLCMDQLDATDKAINYCACGYRMCLWCWNQLMETAGKENLPGRCPNCRAEYDKEKITMSALDPSV